MNVKDKVFLDSNLLIYAHTNLEALKQQKIQLIITREHTCISTQVFSEVANVLYKKFNFAWNDIQKVLQDMEQNSEVFINTPATIQRACQIAERYGFSFYDSLIIASALMEGCKLLYSEDLQDGQVIEQVLTVKNPFI